MTITAVLHSYTTDLDNSDFVGPGPFTATVVHNLGQLAPIVEAYVNPGSGFEKFTPSSITVVDSNTVEIQVSSLPTLMKVYIV